MQVRALIKQYPRTIEVGETVGTALQMMLWHGIRHLPVMRDSKLVGVVSNRDLAWYISRVGSGAVKHPVQEAMHAHPQTAGPDDSLTEVTARMAKDKLGCFPVTEQGRLLSLITTTDVLAAQARDALLDVCPSGLSVGEVMTHSPATVHADDSLLDAIARMQDRNIRHLVVVDGKSKVVGMLSDRDLRSAVGYLLRAIDDEPQEQLDQIKVRQAMTREIISVEPARSLRQLAAEFCGLSVSALPVVDDDDRLLGIVSVVDVLRGLTSN